MQCVNCKFENMPGSQDCARCGTSMVLATAVMDVHPPRAPRWFKPARRMVRHRGAATKMRNAFRQFKATHIAESHIAPDFGPEIALRLIIPGWAQFYLRRRTRGYVFMIGATFALLMALLFIGTNLGNLALGMLFSLHSASISDAVMAPGGTIRESMAGGFLVYVCLGGAIYLPALWLITRVTVPYRLGRDVAPFAEGDVLLVKRFGARRPGDVVIYDRPQESLELPPLGGDHRYIYLGGAGIDRILAGPGDHVQVTHGQLTVNGIPSKFAPLNGVTLPTCDTRIPPATEWIWPSVAGIGGNMPLSPDVGFVPDSQISGRVYFRSSPFSRVGVIH